MIRKYLYFFMVAAVALPLSASDASWDYGVLETAGDVGRFCQARVDSAGDIHVVYLRYDTGEVHVISQAGGVWQSPQVVDSSGSAESDCSVAATGAGVLRCTWRRGGTATLMYAGPEATRSWELGEVTAGGDDIGRDLSVERTPTGEVTAACRNDTDESLVLVRRDAAGVWGAPQVVDPGPDRGFQVDITHRPGSGIVFSERDAKETALMYVDSVLQSNDWEFGPVTSSPDNVGSHLSVHQRDTGAVSVACRNETQGSLVFAIRDTLGAWSALDTIDAGPHRGTDSDHTYRPECGYAFSEHDNGTKSLLYADQELRSHNWKIGTVRAFGDAGRYVSATRMPDGHVACSFYRFDAGTKGSVEAAFNVGTDDYWAIRTVADSIATAVNAPVASDLTITSGWEGFVSFRHDITQHLYYAYNDSVTTAVGDHPSPGVRPLAFGLRPNYPNPFNPRTTISYSIREAGTVRIVIYDVAGRQVRVLVDELRPAGHHALTWDGTDDRGRPAPSGVYFLRLMCNGEYRAQKLVLVK